MLKLIKVDDSLYSIALLAHMSGGPEMSKVLLGDLAKETY